MKKLIFSFAMAFGLLSAPAFAAEAPFMKFEWTPKSKMPELIKAARLRHKGRSMASVDETHMSKESRNLRNEILAAKTGQQVADLLVKLEKNIDEYPKDAQLVASLLLMMKPMRGIVYRMIPLASEQSITHSYLRTMVRSWASNLRLYLPYEHWEAGFAYITEPYEVSPGKVVSQFKSTRKNKATSQFQDYLFASVYPAFGEAIKRIEKIDPKWPMVWDARLAFGEKSFRGDEGNRYRMVYEGERHLILSSLHLGLHYLHYTLAYNVDDVFKLSKDLGRLYGLDGFMYKDVDGVPSYRISQVVKKYPNVFTLREGGKAHMARSFEHFQQGIRELRLAREELRNQPANRLFLVDADRLNPWDEDIERQLSVAECLIEDAASVCPVRSAITGEVVKISLGNFYSNPPKDLKSLMPIAWDTEQKEKRGPAGAKYPNYFWGMPTDWNVSAYRPYFPELKSGADVQKSVRVLRQAYGGEFFGAPLALFVE